MIQSDPVRAAYTATVPYVREWLAYRAWQARLPGLQVAIAFQGELLLSGAWGLADVEAGRRLRTSDLFRVASHSKTFTATAVLQLMEEGALALDDPVGRHVPELVDPPLAGITLRELLEHGGGLLRDGLDSDHWALARPFPDTSALLELISAGGLKTPAGTAFAYSNLGYSLLGRVIESAGGASYADRVRATIIDPLGLENTGPDWDPGREDEFVVGYSSLATSRTRARLPHVTARAMAAATGFYSTAEDLVRYFSAHVPGRGTLLSDHTERLAQRRGWSTDPEHLEGPAYGLGFGADRIGDREVRGHSGGYPGHSSRTYFDPESSLVVSVITNVTSGPADAIARAIIGLLDAAADPDGDPVPDGIDLDSLTGRFASPWGVTDLARIGNQIRAVDPTADAPTASPTRLRVLDADTALIVRGKGYGSVGERIRWSRAADGAVSSVRVGGARSDPWEIPAEEPAIAAALAERSSARGSVEE